MPSTFLHLEHQSKLTVDGLIKSIYLAETRS